MGYRLMYRATVTSSSPASPIPIRYLIEMEGDAFHLEQDLVVFSDAAGDRGSPSGAAKLAGLLYIRRDDDLAGDLGFEVEGRFDVDDTKSVLRAVGAMTFYTEQGFAVFYGDLARDSTQVLAVRCTEVDTIRRTSRT